MTGEIEAAQQAITGGGWAGIMTAIGIASTVAYKSFRKVKEDSSGDRDIEKSQAVTDRQITRMEAEIARQNEVIVAVSAKLDLVTERESKTRADLATAQAGTFLLQGKVKALEQDVIDLKSELAETKAELKEVEAERDKLRLRDNGDLRRYTDHLDDRDRREKE